MESAFDNLSISDESSSQNDVNSTRHIQFEEDILQAQRETADPIHVSGGVWQSDVDESDGELGFGDEEEVRKEEFIVNNEIKKESAEKVNLDELYIDLHEIWCKNLKQYGVKLPGKNGKMCCALVFLYKNINNYVHIDDIKKHVGLFHILTGTDPLQVRHLSTQNGWYIIKRGQYEFCLKSVVKPIDGFIKDKRKTIITSADWNNMLEEYNYMCVNCGNKENEPLRFNKGRITKLQKGHMDPRKDLTLDNCIPQCGFCNQAYKDKAIFNKHGIIIDYNRNGFT